MGVLKRRCVSSNTWRQAPQGVMGDARNSPGVLDAAMARVSTALWGKRALA